MRYKNSKYGLFYYLILSLCLLFISIFTFFILKLIKNKNLTSNELTISIKTLEASNILNNASYKCSYYNCFNVYNCAYKIEGPIKVYIYPSYKYINIDGKEIQLNMSKEFDEILKSIRRSKYFTEDITRACIFVPSIDLLNQYNIDSDIASMILNSLPSWNEGINHLIFNMLSRNNEDMHFPIDINIGKGILASVGFNLNTYRTNFDISIPIYSISKDLRLYKRDHSVLLISSQIGISKRIKSILEEQEGVMILDACSSQSILTKRCDSVKHSYEYPYVLRKAIFCLIVNRNECAQPNIELTLSHCMQMGIIPVVVFDSYLMPFSEVLDWKSASVRVPERSLHKIVDILMSLPQKRLDSMQHQIEFFWNTYFKSVDDIVLTTLKIINDRVFPYAAKSFQNWNEPNYIPSNPLFLPMISPSSFGFTAVVLTYDRIDSLFKVIRKLDNVPSLVKILIIWNNQLKDPFKNIVWPKINKPLKIIQTSENKLSNRFYPYSEIETECVLALDDDILMLTVDELQFGFEVWREFQDRIVGFPSRLHIWNNVTKYWLYESEWGSSISMVLTGAAFYHKVYNRLYTSKMPKEIFQWVDSKVNCEDIAFNFLISNLTGKAPIKVTPRQKFRCPECSPLNNLSFDMDEHMVERSECINHFTHIYGKMQLKTVEFRADPVIFKDNNLGYSDFAAFKDIGSL